MTTTAAAAASALIRLEAENRAMMRSSLQEAESERYHFDISK